LRHSTGGHLFSRGAHYRRAQFRFPLVGGAPKWSGTFAGNSKVAPVNLNCDASRGAGAKVSPRGSGGRYRAGPTASSPGPFGLWALKAGRFQFRIRASPGRTQRRPHRHRQGPGATQPPRGPGAHPRGGGEGGRLHRGAPTGKAKGKAGTGPPPPATQARTRGHRKKRPEKEGPGGFRSYRGRPGRGSAVPRRASNLIFGESSHRGRE